nr:hypothetical protein [uncultured Rhodopila sp.]
MIPRLLLAFRCRKGALSGAGTSGTGVTTMGKGDKQHGNREAKKPKADKKIAPPASTFLKPQPDTHKPGAKPSAK